MISNGVDNSNIKIKNFGVINEASIDISPLTVFIGPNSCGKSFAAKLIHSLSLTPDEDISEISLKHALDSFQNLNETNRNLIFELVGSIRDYLQTNPTLASEPFKIPIDKVNVIVDGGIVVYLSEILEDMIKNQFEDELNELINFNHDYFKININCNELCKKTDEKFDLTVTNITLGSGQAPDNDSKILMKISNDDAHFIFNIESVLLSDTDFEDFSIFLMFYQSMVLSIFRNILLENSFYIPAERSEIIMDKKLLTRKIQNKSDTSKNQSEILVNILNMDSSKKSIFYDIACQLEMELSNIRIDVDDSNIFNAIVYENIDNNREVQSKLLSTSIHEISILILYLKYVLKEGDLLIIEEPEAHMHPANQRLLVKYFTKAVNKGLKILITTHSDYIISQIDNLINLGNISDDKLNELNYSKEDVLDFRDVKIYNFKKNSDNTFDADEVIIGEDGFIEDNFSKIANELYDETISIRNFSQR